jgi:hypothetical protein
LLFLGDTRGFRCAALEFVFSWPRGFKRLRRRQLLAFFFSSTRSRLATLTFFFRRSFGFDLYFRPTIVCRGNAHSLSFLPLLPLLRTPPWFAQCIRYVAAELD